MFLSLTIIREKIIRVKAGPRGRLGLCPDGGCAARVVHRVRDVCIGGCILLLGLPRVLAHDSGLAGFASISLCWRGFFTVF